MKKLLLIIFAMLLTLSATLAQEKLFLQSSSHSRLNTETGQMINYVPVYLHKGSTLRADSGIIYSDELKRDYFDAYGNVTITQPNGTMIFANKLNYAEETQIAILTGNVRMVDGNNVLTTNYLTYNLRSDVGTYVNGGRIVNEQDTITSDKAWYFNQTKDAYFRFDVVVRTPDVKIFTDTMRYNADTKTTYFYGPTNIKGKNDENLYSEDGYYNTETEQAAFYRNNLYTEKSRLLRGDTLLYDGQTGNGQAIGNVLFVDTADQFFAEGMRGLYNKEEESILMTDRPLVTFVVEESEEQPDSVRADQVLTDSLSRDSLRVEQQADLLRDSLGTEEIDKMNETDEVEFPKERKRTDSVFMTADTLYSRIILRRDYVPLDFKLDREGGELDEESTEENFVGDLRTDSTAVDSLMRDEIGRDSLMTDSLGSLELKSDSLQLDSLRKDSVATDSLNRVISEVTKLKEKAAQDSVSDQTKIVKTPPQKEIELDYENRISGELAADSILRKTAIIPKGGEVDSLMTEAALAMLREKPADSLLQDSLSADTAKVRIVKAYNNVRLFKSDLQAVADSAYFSYADSMLRFFGGPMAWTQGSQLSGDSLFLQIKNEKLDNMVIVRNAFVANTKQDSSKYNQIKGRRITGFFTDGKLERVFVDGNAENIAYREAEDGVGYTDMYHSRSARIKILIQNNELTDFIPIKSTEGTIYPLSLVPPEKEILEGFVWKPGDRPRSKEDLLNRKRVITQDLIKADSTAQGETTKEKTADNSEKSPALPLR